MQIILPMDDECPVNQDDIGSPAYVGLGFKSTVTCRPQEGFCQIGTIVNIQGRMVVVNCPEMDIDPVEDSPSCLDIRARMTVGELIDHSDFTSRPSNKPAKLGPRNVAIELPDCRVWRGHSGDFEK